MGRWSFNLGIYFIFTAIIIVSWKVAGSIPDEVTGFSADLIISAALYHWDRLSLWHEGLPGIVLGWGLGTTGASRYLFIWNGPTYVLKANNFITVQYRQELLHLICVTHCPSCRMTLNFHLLKRGYLDGFWYVVCGIIRNRYTCSWGRARTCSFLHCAAVKGRDVRNEALAWRCALQAAANSCLGQ
jgi:hypothetical protein